MFALVITGNCIRSYRQCFKYSKTENTNVKDTYIVFRLYYFMSKTNHTCKLHVHFFIQNLGVLFIQEIVNSLSFGQVAC